MLASFFTDCLQISIKHARGHHDQYPIIKCRKYLTQPEQHGSHCIHGNATGRGLLEGLTHHGVDQIPQFFRKVHSVALVLYGKCLKTRRKGPSKPSATMLLKCHLIMAGAKEIGFEQDRWNKISEN